MSNRNYLLDSKRYLDWDHNRDKCLWPWGYVRVKKRTILSLCLSSNWVILASITHQHILTKNIVFRILLTLFSQLLELNRTPVLLNDFKKAFRIKNSSISIALSIEQWPQTEHRSTLNQQMKKTIKFAYFFN